MLIGGSLVGVETSNTSPEGSQISYREIVDQVSMPRIQQHIQVFANVGSRFTGYPGYYEAMRYIAETFKEYDLTDIGFHEFNVTVPIDYGANVTVLSPSPEKPIKAYSVFPNRVLPVIIPPDGVTGPLVYVGDGELADYTGKDLEGSIVLMKFNVRRKWIDAAKMGAKAVIFTAPEETTREEAELKTINLPFNFPRLYVSKEDGDNLISFLSEGEVTLKIMAKTRWEKLVGRNVIGYIRGTTYPDQFFIISAHYDSFSWIPSVAPGATEAVGISVLLELAKFFKANPPKYTIMFVAFSGYNQGLEGSRWFVEDYFYGRMGKDYTEIGKKVIFLMNLDITDGTDIPVLCNSGGFYGAQWNRANLKWSGIADYVFSIQEEANRQLGLDIEVNRQGVSLGAGGAGAYSGMVHLAPMYPIFPSDAEPMFQNRGSGMLITTAQDRRVRYRTPLDTYDRLNFYNIKINAWLVHCILHTLVQTENFAEVYAPSTFNRMHDPPALDMGFSGYFFKGHVGYYNESIAWYTPLANAIIWMHRPLTEGSCVDLWQMTDKNGNFYFPNMYIQTGAFNIEAYMLNETTGNIIYGPDLGRFTYAPHSMAFLVDEEVGFYAVHKCGTLILLDAVDPEFWGGPPQSAGDVSLSFSIFRQDSHTAPWHYGYTISEPWGAAFDDAQSAAAFYLEPNQPVEIIMQSIYATRYPLGLMINASQEHPTGSGYKLNPQEQYVISHPKLSFAEDLYWLGNSRLTVLSNFGLNISYAKEYKETKGLLEQAYQALENKQYYLSEMYATKAWSIGRKVYIDTRLVTEDAVYTTLFYLALSMPFIFLLERIIFAATAKKRLLVIAGLYTSFMLLFVFMHPGVGLASDALMVLLGVSVLILSLPIMAILVGMFYSTIKGFAVSMRGLHLTEISRGSAAIMAYSIGIQYGKRRKLRFVLTITTICLISTGFVMFTSTSAILLTRPFPIQGTPSYQGVLIKRPSYGLAIFGITEEMLSALQRKYEGEAVICPRAELHTLASSNPSITSYVAYGNRTAGAYAYFGLAPQESEVSTVEVALLPGGRWFTDYDNYKYKCIIGGRMADKLGIRRTPVDLMIEGVSFEVVGIVNSTIFQSITGLDGEPITPLDLTAPSQTYNSHASMDSCILMPLTTAVSLGCHITSVSIVFEDVAAIPSAAEDIFFTTPALETYVGFQDKMYLLTARTAFTVIGWQFQVVPMLLGCFVILNLMLGNMHERTRDISIYSSVGLSPLHISFMFLSETSVYAVVGGVLGYLIAMILSKIGAITGFMTAMNFASTWVLTATGVAMGVTLLSTLYPAREVSKKVTPSLERVWRIPTRPIGSEWNIPLPFIVSTDEEVKGIIVYIQEYIRPHIGQRAELFSVLNTSYEEKTEAERITNNLIVDTKLEPYERGISQRTEIRFAKDLKTERWSVEVLLRKISGSTEAWITSNRRFMDRLRKQLLLWRSLMPEEKNKYTSKFKSEEAKI